MRTYNYVQSTCLKPFLNIRNLFCSTETADIINIARKVFQSVLECIEMLERKNCRRYKDSYLLAVCHSLECSPDSHFSLTESDIAAHKPVHRTCIFHIPLYSLHSLFLIRSVLIHERRLELLLKICIRRKSETSCTFPLGIKLYKILGNILYLGFGAGLEILPCLRSEFMYLWRLSIL